MALNSPKLQSVTALWLSYREQRGLSTMYRFTTHGVCGSRPCTVYDRVATLVVKAALLAAVFLFCVRSIAFGYDTTGGDDTLTDSLTD